MIGDGARWGSHGDAEAQRFYGWDHEMDEWHEKGLGRARAQALRCTCSAVIGSIARGG